MSTDVLKQQDILQKIQEAYEDGYIPKCPKCGSFKTIAYVDENYFSDPLRYSCRDCKHKGNSGQFGVN